MTAHISVVLRKIELVAIGFLLFVARISDVQLPLFEHPSLFLPKWYFHFFSDIVVLQWRTNRRIQSAGPAERFA